jgi:hypothetical protein
LDQEKEKELEKEKENGSQSQQPAATPKPESQSSSANTNASGNSVENSTENSSGTPALADGGRTTPLPHSRINRRPDQDLSYLSAESAPSTTSSSQPVKKKIGPIAAIPEFRPRAKPQPQAQAPSQQQAQRNSQPANYVDPISHYWFSGSGH